MAIFGRNENGNIALFDSEDGERITRLDGYSTVYPVGSDVSVCYEHPTGIVLTPADARRVGVDTE